MPKSSVKLIFSQFLMVISLARLDSKCSDEQQRYYTPKTITNALEENQYWQQDDGYSLDQ